MMPSSNDNTQFGSSQGLSSNQNTLTQGKGHNGRGSTDKQWKEEVLEFLRVIENGGESAVEIRPAWKKLRQSYAQKFDATIANTATPSTNFDPFPLWAAKTFDEKVLNRVLRIEFSSQLAQCNFMSLLQSTATMGNTSMWHLILYFGTSLFSAQRLKFIRKRKHIFVTETVGRPWLFTEAYKNMLRQTAATQRLPLDSTTIPSSETLPLFTSRELSTLAPPNPEFQLRPQAKSKADKAAASTASFGVAADKEGKSKGKGNGKRLQAGATKQEDAPSFILSSESLQGRRNSLNYGQREGEGKGGGRSRGGSGGGRDGREGEGESEGEGEGDASSESAKDRADPHEKNVAEKQPPGHRTSAYTHGNSTLVPRKRRSGADEMQTQVFSDLLPSVESPEQTKRVNDGPPRKARILASGTKADDEPVVQSGGRLTRAQRLDQQQARHVARRHLDQAHAANILRLQRESSLNPTAVGTPAVSKRLIKGEDDDNDFSKRPEMEMFHPAVEPAQHSHTAINQLEKSHEWTDATVLGILKKLEAIRSEEFVVVDGMNSYSSTADRPSALTVMDVRKGTILLPLKLNDGYRILAVLHLDVVKSSGPPDLKPKQGTILYFDPADSNAGNFFRGYQLAARIAQVLAYLLPGRNFDPGAWDMEYCTMPKQQIRGNTGVAICLAAMCVVGSKPRMAQIPEEADWMFWRHFILRCFHGSDEIVRSWTDDYRFQTIHTLVRQGQVRGQTSEYQYASDNEIECLGHTTKDPMQRLLQRETNVQRLFQVVHQGHIICLDLMSHIDRGMASLKIKFDKSQNLANAPEGSASNISGEIKEEQVPEAGPFCNHDQESLAEFFSFDEYKSRQHVVQEAARCLSQAIDEASIWRNAIHQAVLETDYGSA